MTELARLDLTGGFRLVAADGREVQLSSRKARGLLAYLALTPGNSASRAKLRDLLWSDRGEQQAGDSLRQLLASLRKELADAGCGILTVRDDHIGLNTEAVAIDVSLIIAGDAAELYQGLLLEGLDVGDNEFETWLAAERASLQSHMQLILERLAATQQGDVRVATARKLLALDPLREASHRALIAALLAAGETPLAKKQLDACRVILKHELGLDPAPETEAMLLQQAPAAAVSKPVIAVLPFANLSDDPAQKYFSDGIGSDIGTELSRFRQFIVRASGTAQDQARGASYAVDGSVRRLGQRIRISVQLIDVESGQQLWSERFDAPETEIFDMQDRIVHSIAAQLADRLRLAGLEKAQRKPPANLAAYDLVLRGDALPIGDEAAEEEARQLFARAIELDPGYARAYAYLGEYMVLLWLRDLDAPRELVEQALELTRKAIALDGGDAFCHAMLGHVQLYNRAHGPAEFHYQKAVALNPNQPGMLGGLGILYGFMGDAGRGLEYFQSALELDPHFDPTWYWRNRAVVHFIARQYQEAIAAFQRSPISPGWVEAYLAACHAHLDRLAEARLHAANAMRLTRNLTIVRFLTKEPYVLRADAEHLADGLRKAGIPE